ncbi:hypothetical protein [Streptomyces lydicus]|uniref:hypothetical protein n=1 Tax=Streptomyces lydicus TaxID=47763 RepID=UPI0037902A48
MRPESRFGAPLPARGITASPYSALLDHLGVPFAGTIMDFGVLTAVLSCLNSGIYSSSTHWPGAVRRRACWAHTSRSGVPTAAVIAASRVGLLVLFTSCREHPPAR